MKKSSSILPLRSRRARRMISVWSRAVLSDHYALRNSRSDNLLCTFQKFLLLRGEVTVSASFDFPLASKRWHFAQFLHRTVQFGAEGALLRGRGRVHDSVVGRRGGYQVHGNNRGTSTYFGDVTRVIVRVGSPSWRERTSRVFGVVLGLRSGI